MTQGIQSEHGLKTRLGAKKLDETNLTVHATKNAIEITLKNCFPIPLDFQYFKQLVCTYYLHENLTVISDLNKPEKIIFCSGDTAATYAISDISLEYDAIINAVYMEKVSRI